MNKVMFKMKLGENVKVDSHTRNVHIDMTPFVIGCITMVDGKLEHDGEVWFVPNSPTRVKFSSPLPEETECAVFYADSPKSPYSIVEIGTTLKSTALSISMQVSEVFDSNTYLESPGPSGSNGPICCDGKLEDDEEDPGGMGLVDAVADYRKKHPENRKGFPKVNIDALDLRHHSYTERNLSYPFDMLLAKSKEYPEFDYPLAAVDLSRFPWSGQGEDFRSFLHHLKRAMDSDLTKPIFLDSDGYICDGWHRVAKAIYLGHTSIRAIRFEEMPMPYVKEKPESKK